MEYTNQMVTELINSVERLNVRFTDLENQIFTQQNNDVMIVQSLNMQIQLLNQMSQSVNNLTNKMSDIEITLNNTDDFGKEIIDTQNSIIIELSELKQTVEGVKFYVLNQSGNYGNNF